MFASVLNKHVLFIKFAWGLNRRIKGQNKQNEKQLHFARVGCQLTSYKEPTAKQLRVTTKTLLYPLLLLFMGKIFSDFTTFVFSVS